MVLTNLLYIFIAQLFGFLFSLLTSTLALQ